MINPQGDYGNEVGFVALRRIAPRESGARNVPDARFCAARLSPHDNRHLLPFCSGITPGLRIFYTFLGASVRFAFYTANMILARVAGVLMLLLMAASASSAEQAGLPPAGGEFVGTTPGDVRSREFLGGLATNVGSPGTELEFAL